MDMQQPRDSVTFGPFRLFATERLLERDGVPVNLGGRALDILLTLVERAGEVISTKELIAAVWPDVTVDDGSLRFHIAGLRKMLGDGKDGARYVANVWGRGYCFVAPVQRAGPLVVANGDAPRLAVPAADRAIAFGRFRLEPDRQVLLEGGKPVPVGTRALEILIALLEPLRNY
jgi:DNA-binding winged helix-turn-helix (wHTH) protein